MMEDVAILLMLAMLLMIYAQVAQDRQVRRLQREQETLTDLLVSIAAEIGITKVARHD
jgi:branched-subunit amino acid ABC-type transport system permease component